MARCITFPHPFSSDRKIEDIPCGTIVEDAIISQKIDRKYVGNLTVHLWHGDDGETFDVLEKSKWATYKLKDDDNLVISVQPKGGGGGFAGLTKWIGGLNPIAKIGLQIAGTFGLNALLGGKQKKFTQGQAWSASNTYNLTGPANRKRTYEPIERVYGKHRVYPSIAAGSFSTYSGASQTINALFCYGYGPLSITDLKIGETALAECDPDSTTEGNTKYEIRYGYDTDEPISTFPTGVTADVHSIELTDRVYYTETTTVECVSADIEMVYPMGLYRTISRGVRAVYHRLFIEYKKVGEDESAYVAAYSTPDTAKFKRKTTERFSETRRITFPESGKYDVRVHMERDLSHAGNGAWQAVWTQTKCITGSDDGDLVSVKGVALMALMMKDAQSTNGQIGNISGICTSILNVWNSDAEEWVLEATANPAWIYLDILTGSANSRAVSYDRVDLDAIKEWAEFCDEQIDDANRFEFNGVFDTATTVFEALKTVALAGRASFAMVDGKYSVFVDKTKDEAVQQFTPRNSWKFSAVKNFPDEVDAIRARFVNPDNFWQQDETLVYDDDHDASTAEYFSEVEYFGVTSEAQAYRLARYDIAVRTLRPETYTLNVDVENIICTRGDRVKVSHDIPGWGISSGRISSVTTSDDGLSVVSAILDGKVVFELGKTYGISVRNSSGIVSYSVLESTDLNNVIFSTAISLSGAPAAGDLYSFGETDSETVDLLVKTITYKNDLSATMEFVDYSPGVFTADTEEIPDFDAQISTTPQLPIYPPSVPTIEYMASDDSTLLVDTDGYCTPRLLVVLGDGDDGMVVPRQTVQIRYRKEGDQYWEYLSNNTGTETDFYIDGVDVDDEKDYEIAARAISRAGIRSDWSDTSTHTVVGQIATPDDVTDLTATVKTDYVKLTWSHGGGYYGTKVWFEIRVGDSWDEGIFVAEPDDVYTYFFPIEDSESFTIWMRAKNQANIYSENAQSVEVEAVAPDDVFGFVGIEMDEYINFSWEAVEGTGMTYEIREGLSWKQGTSVATSTSTTISVYYPVAEVETHTFFIKALATNGLYSENAGSIEIELNPDGTATVYLESDRKALFWDGQLLNFDITTSNNLQSSGTYSEYVYSIDLGSSMTTKNFYSIAFDEVVRTELTWDDADFIWSSDRADSQWDNSGSEEDFSYTMQIALHLDTTPSYVYENFEFDNDLDGSVLSTTPTTSSDITYEANRFHDGVNMTADSKLAYDITFPEEFSMSFTWKGLDQDLLSSGVNLIMRLEDAAGTRMLILQDSTSFYLLDENNNQLAMDMVIEADQYYNIVVAQYETSRTFGVYDVANDTYSKDTGDFAPITTFTKINFRFTD